MKTVEQLLENGFYLSDGGLETTLIFHEGIELNFGAAFELLLHAEGRSQLQKYFREYLDMAAEYQANFILETPTWRANPDWSYKLGYSTQELRQINFQAVQFLKEIKTEYETRGGHILISGCIGPRGDGYRPGKKMQAEAAAEYHFTQIDSLARAGADMTTAFTINYTEEAMGIAQAAKNAEIPVVISFTLETDGRLPTGESLRTAIERVDEYSNSYVTYFMINCAHPEHFTEVLKPEGEWKKRIAAIRANASDKSHAELDESENLDTGDCNRLVKGYAEIKNLLPDLKVVGGCCGTDLSHIRALADKFFENKTILQP
ncbi:MAG: homocysteine S-methyltransferase family protein [Mariniphaga sp.]